MEDLSHIKLDTRPGNYYASVMDPEKPQRISVLAGPYKTHQEALNIVDTVKDIAREVDPWSVFYGFGTCRLPEDYPNPPLGKLNNLLEEEYAAAKKTP